jgi:hypothetical protein
LPIPAHPAALISIATAAATNMTFFMERVPKTLQVKTDH